MPSRPHLRRHLWAWHLDTLDRPYVCSEQVDAGRGGGNMSSRVPAGLMPLGAAIAAVSGERGRTTGWRLEARWHCCAACVRGWREAAEMAVTLAAGSCATRSCLAEVSRTFNGLGSCGRAEYGRARWRALGPLLRNAAVARSVWERHGGGRGVASVVRPAGGLTSGPGPTT